MSRISEIEQRLSKRTQGEMKFIAAEFKEDGIVAFEVRMAEPVISFADADFYNAAPSDLAYLLEQVKWIPVSERMPEPQVLVLVSDGEKVSAAKFHTEVQEYWEEINRDTKKKKTETVTYWSHLDDKAWMEVTHWRPLPAPPESEGGTK
jgi:hypothetical protein